MSIRGFTETDDEQQNFSRNVSLTILYQANNTANPSYTARCLGNLDPDKDVAY